MNTNNPGPSKDRKDVPPNDQKPSEKKDQGGQYFKNGDDIFAFAKSNKEQAIAYILLALGLLFLLFWHNLLGGLIIGAVAGYYFSNEIIYYLRSIGQIVGGQNQLRYVVLTAVLLGLFIAAPGIFIGALIVAAFKRGISGPSESSKSNGSTSSKP